MRFEFPLHGVPWVVPLSRAEWRVELHTISGDYGWRVPPVPIPNTEVKPPRADGTWLATAREMMASPDSNFAPKTFVFGVFSAFWAVEGNEANQFPDFTVEFL